jgi:hypothetical protein
MEEKKNAYRILVGRPEGKRALAKLRHRWEGIDPPQDRNQWRALVNTVMNLQVP